MNEKIASIANKTFPVLYVLVRTMDSMNPGKAEAHSGHAANAFVEKTIVRPLLDGPDEMQVSDLAMEWRTATTQGFGTQINLYATFEQMKSVVELATRLGFDAEIVHDPEYPLFDGTICHHLPMDTAAYVFGDKNDPIFAALMNNFELKK